MNPPEDGPEDPTGSARVAGEAGEIDAGGEVWCVVVAGGSGHRFGSAKQFAALGAERVIDRSTRVAAQTCDGVVAVVPQASLGRGPEGEVPHADLIVGGGRTRSESSLAGVRAVPLEASVILVHDAARPLATPELFAEVIDEVRGGEAAVVPVVAVSDTIRDVDGRVVDRERLRAVQTPQGFDAGTLRSALAAGTEATDDAGAVEAAGTIVTTVPGDPRNRKITAPEDLAFAQAVIGAVGGTMAVDEQERCMDVRVGNGFDIHVFSDDPARRMVLGGVHMAGEPGLVGHSDADVLVHAVGEALLGAAGLGDLGSHFPDDDERFRGADSLELLTTVVAHVAADGWRVGNVDCSVIAERPKLAPHRSTMQANLSAVVGAPVSVKGRRAEGLGALGRSEGIAVMASAVLLRGEATAGRGAFEQQREAF